MSAPDIAKIVSLIMENPKLIAEISALAKQDEEKAPEVSVQKEDTVRTDAKIMSDPEPAPTQRGKSRSELLFALKPYVSRDRAQAIDSMISVVEILDLMKRR